MAELTAFQRERVRRSQRVSLAVPIRLTSLDPEIIYSESCRTFVVNRHGCGVHAPQPLAPQTAVQIEVGPGRATAQARVVMCAPASGEKDVWELGIELDEPENIWGIQFPPSDWVTGKSAEPLRPAPARAVLRAEPESRSADSAAPTETTAVAPPSALPPPAPAAVVPAPVASTEPVEVALETTVPAPEVSFSLDEISDTVQSSTPLALEPSTLTEELPPTPAAPPEVEAELRRKARAIAAEFEEDYRRSLGELLARLRADLEGQATDDWNHLRRQAEEQVQSAAGEQRARLQQDFARLEESQRQLATKLEELTKLQAYVESLLRLAPQTLEQQLQEGTAAAMAEARARGQQELAEAGRAQNRELEQHLRAALSQAAQEARQRLLDDFDRHEREFLDRIAVRLEEVRASADHTREFTKRASADIARQSEQLRIDLQTQFESLFEEHRRSLAARLEERHRRLDHAARAALETLGGRLWESLRERLNADFDARTRALQESLQTAQAETRELRELAARLDTGLQARLDQAVEDTVRRTESHLQQLQAAARGESDERLAAEREQTQRLHAETQQAFAAALQAQRAALLAEFQRELESAAAESRSSFHSAMRQTLNSIGEILEQPGTNLEPGAKEP